MIMEFKKHVNNFAMSCLKVVEAEKAEAAAKQKLDAAMDNILASKEARHGIPLPIKPKIKGN